MDCAVMDKDKQIIAIAEFCGWTNIKPDLTGSFGRLKNTYLPDYLNDLNAMHEAENILWDRNDGSFCDYVSGLDRINGSWGQLSTARQRAEVLLRTIGKWED
jgi:hypothetical protein